MLYLFLAESPGECIGTPVRLRRATMRFLVNLVNKARGVQYMNDPPPETVFKKMHVAVTPSSDLVGSCVTNVCGVLFESAPWCGSCKVQPHQFRTRRRTMRTPVIILIICRKVNNMVLREVVVTRCGRVLLHRSLIGRVKRKPP